MKENKKASPNKNINFYIKLALIIVILFVLILFSLLEYNHVINCEGHIDGLIANLVAVIPLVITIVTISLTIPDTKIYGLTITEFRKFRNDCHFSLFEMIIITVFSFAICSILSYFNLPISLFILFGFTILISLVFSYKEITVIINNRNYIKKLIKQVYEEVKDDIDECLDGKSSKVYVCERTMQHIVVKEGILSAFDSLKNNDETDNKLIAKLLKLLDDYANDYMELVKCNNGKFVSEFKNEDIIESTNIILNDINNILVKDGKIDLLNMYDTNKYAFIYFCQIILDYRELFKLINLEEKYKEKLSEIFELRLCYEELNKTEKINFVRLIKYLFVNSISKDDLWFCDVLRDSFVSMGTFENDNVSIFIFLIICIYTVRNIDADVPSTLKDKIDEFLNSPSNNMNGNNWTIKDKLNQVLYNDDQSDLVGLLPDLLDYFRIFENGPGHIYNSKKVNNKMLHECTFTIEVIIDCYMEIILSSCCNYICNKELINNMIESIDDNAKKEVSDYIINNWYVDRRIVQFKRDFSEYYNLVMNNNSRLHEESTIYKLRDGFEKVKEELIVNSSIKDSIKIEEDEKIVNAVNTLVKLFQNAQSKVNIGNKTDVRKQKMSHYFLLNNYCLDNIEKVYYRYFDNYISMMLSKYIKEYDSIKRINVEDANLCDIIKDHKIDLINRDKSYFINRDEKDEFLDDLDKLKLCDLNVSELLMWNNNSLDIHFEVNKDECSIRKMNEEELEYLIKNKYRVVDGLYKYESELNGKVYAYLPYEKLKQILENKYLVAVMSFNFYFEVGKDIYIVDSK